MNNGTPLEQARQAYRINLNRPLRPSAIDNQKLLQYFHPDYADNSRVALKVGVNRHDPCHPQLAALLQSDSPTIEAMLATATQIETEVLVIGSGGAGCSAALVAGENGANVLIATKLRVGDSNTVMAEGGIQASIEANDTPQAHFDETLKAGHYCSDKRLVEQMVLDGPEVIQWLIQQGMQFDRDEQGNLCTRRAGGTSANRVLYCRDYTGLEMMRVLRESVRQHHRITTCDYTPAVELLSNKEGHCSGALLYSIETQRYTAVKAKSVILASGGLGRMHLNGFPTSNHVGATGDGLVLAYRLGAQLQALDSFQYHPTGLAWPQTLAGTLITEGIRSTGAQLVNNSGERFIDELAPRDVVCAAIMRECEEGRGIRLESGRQGVWLDIPTLEKQQPGILAQQFPKFMALCNKADINPYQSPLLICPTLHYQNGGVVINQACETTIPGLYCAGEVSGGIHGKNRIMGNALLEIISFGRRAGAAAVARHSPDKSQLLLNHLQAFRREIKNSHGVSGIQGPLLFPHYASFSRKGA
ncbi:MAG: FAD-binding protein [Gammaproteobacteria bacterium]|nr:FAD-binding protein [Gammaproteobacteria bacterium]